MYYLTNTAALTGKVVLLDLLPAFYLDRDTPDKTLTDAGWRYAKFNNTGLMVLVRSKGNRRYLKAWRDFVTDFEVCEVETVVSDGAIWTGKGKPKSLKLFTKTCHVERGI